MLVLTRKHIKKWQIGLGILFLLVACDAIYSNSEHYLSSYLWKQVNDAGRLCGDNIVFKSDCYVREWPHIRYFGRDYQGKIVGNFLFCFNFGFESRLWVYSYEDKSVGVYRNVIPENHGSE